MPTGIFIVSFSVCGPFLSVGWFGVAFCFAVSQLLAYYLCSTVRWTSQVKSEMEILKNRLRTISVFTCSSHQRRQQRQRQWQRNFYYYFISLHMSEAVELAASIPQSVLFCFSAFCECIRATVAATAASAAVAAAVDNKKMNVAHLKCHFIVSAFFFFTAFHVVWCLVRHSRRVFVCACVCECVFEARWMK